MYKYIIILSLFLFASSAQAQKEYDLKDYFTRRQKYIRTGDKCLIINLKGGDYIKDISGVLPPFCGTWVGTFKDYGYVIALKKIVTPFENPEKKRDNLEGSYAIYQRDSLSRWTLVEKSGGYSDRNFIKGYAYYPSGSYSFKYSGNEARQTGEILARHDGPNKLNIYMMDLLGFGMMQGPQLFPVYDRYKKLDDSCTLNKYSSSEEVIPLGHPKGRIDIGVLGYFYVRQAQLRNLLSGYPSVIPLYAPEYSKLFVYDFLPQWNLGGEESEAYRSAVYIDNQIHLCYDDSGIKRRYRDPMRKLAFIHAMSHKLLLQTLMLRELQEKLSPSDYERCCLNFKETLQHYAKHRGMQVAVLKDRIIKESKPYLSYPMPAPGKNPDPNQSQHFFEDLLD